MHIFDDLKSPEEELKNYFALYNIVLPKHRIAYYAEVLEDMIRNKEPVIKYLEDLIEIVKKKEPSFNKGTYQAWRRYHKDIPEEDAFKQFSIDMEEKKQAILDNKERILKKKLDFQLKKERRIQAKELMDNYTTENFNTKVISVLLDTMEVMEHNSINDASEHIKISSVANIYTYSRTGNAIGGKYMVRILTDNK